MLFSGKGFPWNSRLLSDGISAKITRLAEWTRKLNLPTDCGERPASHKKKKNNFKVDIFSIPLANSYYNNEWTPLIYIAQTVENLLRLTCKFYLDKSERNAIARKHWPNGLASGFKLKTWVYLRLRLAIQSKCSRFRICELWSTSRTVSLDFSRWSHNLSTLFFARSVAWR